MTREEILATNTIRQEAVEVPEWGGTFYVRALNAAERLAAFDAMNTDPLVADHPLRKTLLLLTHCLRNEAGERIFVGGDFIALEQQDGGLINRLAGAVNRVLDLSAEAQALTEKK